MNIEEEHKHNWRAYGQPDGTVVCDGCNLADDVNNLINSAKIDELEHLKDFREIHTWTYQDGSTEKTVAILYKVLENRLAELTNNSKGEKN